MENERKQKVQQIYAAMIAEHGAGRVFGDAETVIAALNRYTLPAGMIVDIGCGNGAVTLAVAHAFPRRYVMGIDFSPEQLVYAHTHHSGVNVMYSHGDADDLPYIHAAALYSAATVQYVESVPQFLSAVFERLNPGGVLWYSVQLIPAATPEREAIREVWQQFMHHTVSFYSAAEHIQFLQAAGFQDVEAHIKPIASDSLTPKRLEILQTALETQRQTIQQAEANGWLAMGEFTARKP
jgi:trans-aconitate methyltransferase